MRLPSRFAACAFSACAFSSGFYLVTSILLRRWLRPPPAPCGSKFEPVTFFRPIKSGEPHLAADLSIFFQSLEPEDQVLIGTDSENDLRICANLVRESCLPNVSCLRCVPSLHDNPKVNKLVQMESLARHKRWIILDSDTRPDRQFLRAFRAEWESTRADAISAPYAFTDCESEAARLDAIGTSLSLWPGVAMLRATGRIDFLTGACMGIKAQILQARGGWSILGSVLADDYELGRVVLQTGGRIHMASACISLRAGKMNWLEWVLHQHRTFATYRLCNPLGSLALPLTHGVAISFALALVTPRSLFRWTAHAVLFALRWACLNSLPSPAPLPLQKQHRQLCDTSKLRPVRTWIVCLFEPIFWLSSWILPSVRWSGKWIRPRKITD